MQEIVIRRKAAFLASIVLFLCTLFSINQAIACTRVVYKGTNGTILTARSMDWKTEIPAELWVFPRGMERNGRAGSTSIHWQSKYGSVITSSWNIATSDGMNEKGLAGNMLWLVESKYPEFKKDQTPSGLSISLWLQYILDNFATVDEAVKALSKEAFVVVTYNIPDTKRLITVHISISDKTGDNAILEYVNGKLVIHHDKSYVTMTNSPLYEKQLAINDYWKNIPGTTMLPGTNKASDRFVRASYYTNAVPKTDDVKVAVPTAFSVIRNASVPFGISTPDEPNISSTRWRIVADQKNLTYYFETVLNYSVVWVDFKNIDFSKTGKVKKLDVENNPYYSGESSKYLKVTQPFDFEAIP
jgi:choloylglycine hydrolase